MNFQIFKFPQISKYSKIFLLALTFTLKHKFNQEK